MSGHCTGNEGVLQWPTMTLESFNKRRKSPPIADDLRSQWPDVLPLNKAPFFWPEIRKHTEYLRRNMETLLKIRLSPAQAADLRKMAGEAALQFHKEQDPFNYLQEIQARFVYKYFGLGQEEFLKALYFDEQPTRRFIQIRQCEHYRAG